MQHEMSLPPPSTGVCSLRVCPEPATHTGRVLGQCPPGHPGADAGLVRKVV